MALGEGSKRSFDFPPCSLEVNMASLLYVLTAYNFLSDLQSFGHSNVSNRRPVSR